MPAQRRKKRTASLNKKKVGLRKYIYFAILILLVFLFISVKLTTKFWNGKDKIIIAFPTVDQNVKVSIIEPEAIEITNITIPGSTQVEVAHKLGIWRLASIWELGKNEKLGGALLVATLTKHLKFPVFAWADEEGEGLVEDNFFGIIKAVVHTKSSNLKIGDRLRIALFNLSLPNTKKVDINLAETSYLKKEILADGEEGYIVSKSIASEILSLFAEPYLSEKSLKVSVRNASADRLLAGKMGEVIEVLGAKVALISNSPLEDIDCSVNSKDKKSAEIIAKYFNCKISDINQSGFDVEIVVGQDFADRF